MENNVEYDIISCATTSELIEEINEALKLGWIPMGGVCAVGNALKPLFLQAVVRQLS